MLNPSVRTLALAALFAAFTIGCPGGAGEGGEGEGEEGEGEEGEGEEGEGEEGEGEEGEGEEGEGEEGEGEEGEGEGELAANCANGTDDDGDVLIDLADPGCNADPPSEANDDQCNDGLDNDFDFIVDQDDPFCVSDNHEATADILPDLTVHDVRDDVFTNGGQPIFTTEDADDVDHAEEFADGCYSGTGQRTLIEFNGIIKNIGDRDLRVGDTDDHLPTWSADNGFGDLQLAGWLRFFVFDSGGTLVAEGHKGSFCMLDNFPGLQACNAQFGNCNNGQGISAGCGDVYSIGLPCQFVDVTGVAPGDYLLRIETNFLGQLPESDYTNNFAELTFVIP